MDKKFLGGLALGLVLATSLFLAFPTLQSGLIAEQVSPPKPVQAPPLEKFKAIGGTTSFDGAVLLRAAAKELGFWGRNGLDPDLITKHGSAFTAAELKDHVASGTKIGHMTSTELLLARSNGVPVKLVAGYWGDVVVKLYVKGDGPIKTVQDLDSKKVGVHGPTESRHMAYLAKKFGINPYMVPKSNLTDSLVALKLGSIDSFMSADAFALRLVDSGELRILLHLRDVIPKPYVSLAVFATEDLINENPDLVRRFVKATLETVKYLKENPAYASYLFSRTTGAPKDLSDKTVLQHNWTPDGLGGGRDLLDAVRTTWQYHLDSGGLPPNVNLGIEDAVDARFLP